MPASSFRSVHFALSILRHFRGFHSPRSAKKIFHSIISQFALFVKTFAFRKAYIHTFFASL